MRNNRLNRWLTSTVDAYIEYYGKNPEPIIYEAGSRDGRDAHELAERIGGTNPEIVLFECNPPQIELIKRTYPNATLITEAVSDKKGTTEFLQIHGDQNFMGSSTMNTARNDKWIKETTIIQVKTRRMDDVIEELGHQKKQIDIMKVDLEGYTYEALQGLGKYLRNVRVFELETEIEGYARKYTNTDIAEFMKENGYKLVDIFYEWPPDIEDHVYVRID